MHGALYSLCTDADVQRWHKIQFWRWTRSFDNSQKAIQLKDITPTNSFISTNAILNTCVVMMFRLFRIPGAGVRIDIAACIISCRHARLSQSRLHLEGPPLEAWLRQGPVRQSHTSASNHVSWSSCGRPLLAQVDCMSPALSPNFSRAPWL